MYALGSDGMVYGYNDSIDEWFPCGAEVQPPVTKIQPSKKKKR